MEWSTVPGGGEAGTVTQRERSRRVRARWRRLVSEQGRSARSVAAFCRERRLCVPHFYWWKKRLGESSGAKSDGASRFVEVKVAAAPEPSTPTDARMEIRLRNGRNLVVGRGCDAEQVRALGLRASELAMVLDGIDVSKLQRVAALRARGSMSAQKAIPAGGGRRTAGVSRTAAALGEPPRTGSSRLLPHVQPRAPDRCSAPCGLVGPGAEEHARTLCVVLECRASVQWARLAGTLLLLPAGRRASVDRLPLHRKESCAGGLGEGGARLGVVERRRALRQQAGGGLLEYGRLGEALVQRKLAGIRELRRKRSRAACHS